MAIKTNFVDNKTTTVKIGTDQVYSENVLDFTIENAGASDVVQAIKIPKGAIVTNAGIILKVAEGGTLTAQLGDTVDPNGWVAALFDLNGAVDTTAFSLPGDAFPALGGKLYTADTTIDLLLSANVATTATVIVFALYSVSDNYKKLTP